MVRFKNRYILAELDFQNDDHIPKEVSQENFLQVC